MRYLAPILLLASFACAQAQAPAPSNPRPPSLSDLTTTTDNWSIRLSDPMITIGGIGIIEVMNKDGKLMIRIDRDGHSTLGDGYHPDAGAKAFWEAMAKYYPIVCTKPATIAPKEGQPK